MKKSIALIAAALFGVGAVIAADDPAAGLKAKLKEILPGEEIEAVRNTPIDGLYEVSLGSRLFYMSADGRYLVKGDVIDLEGGTNLTEERRNAARLKALAAVGEENMLVYPAKGEAKHTISVFTDIDCGYCRKLHQGMEEMNELGITVRYLAFPRSGIGSPSYNKWVSVWCADDPHKAMTAAKAEEEVPAASCENPVDEHLKLVRDFNLTGTPALVLEDGTVVPGYVPPKRLFEALEQQGS